MGGRSREPSQVKENWQPVGLFGALINDAADRLGEIRVPHPVEDGLGHRLLAAQRLQRGLVVDRLGHAQFGPLPLRPGGAQVERRGGRKRIPIGRHQGVEALGRVRGQDPDGQARRADQVQRRPAVRTVPQIAGAAPDRTGAPAPASPGPCPSSIRPAPSRPPASPPPSDAIRRAAAWPPSAAGRASHPASAATSSAAARPVMVVLSNKPPRSRDRFAPEAGFRLRDPGSHVRRNPPGSRAHGPFCQSLNPRGEAGGSRHAGLRETKKSSIGASRRANAGLYGVRHLCSTLA